MTQTIELAVIPGDGIGKEVVPEGLKVLAAALEGTGVGVATTDFDLGADRWHRTGETLTDADLEAIKGHDAILLGAVGDFIYNVRQSIEIRQSFISRLVKMLKGLCSREIGRASCGERV